MFPYANYYDKKVRWGGFKVDEKKADLQNVFCSCFTL